MSYREIRSATPIARQDHECNACLWLDNGALDDIAFELSFAQKRDVVKHIRHNKGQIKKGDRYLFAVGIQDGEIVNTKSIPEIHAICIEFELYEC